ncbi:MAG: glycosyltransferase [bacterium]|nr:glycosyltransferase [bacterium]
MNQTFFSIIIPSHNEEKYISATLDRIKQLSYPKSLFEALVIENGSTDKTKEIALTYADDNINIYVSDKGVSKAKNYGLSKISERSDWVILLDADTLLEKSFLEELNLFFSDKDTQKLSVGTTDVLPAGDQSVKARLWYKFYNFGHKLTKSSYSIQILKSSLKDKLKFDESIQFGEDLKLIKEARQFGKFFYIETRSVRTSTRRFDNVGYFRQFILWNYEALILSRTRKKNREYKVIR